MKNLIIIIAAFAVFGLSSCSTITNSASTQQIGSKVMSASTADLEIAPKRITYKYITEKAVRKGGYKNVINTAVMQALATCGGDVLVDPQYSVKHVNSGIFGSKVAEVIVTGYPARYKNFQSISKDVLEQSFLNGTAPSGSLKK